MVPSMWISSKSHNRRQGRRHAFTQIRLALTSLCLILAISLLAVPHIAEARSFRFTNLRIEAEVLPDGSLQIVEHRTAQFSGTFSGMYQWIRKDPGVSIVDVAVGEEGKPPYTFRPGATDYGPAGTFYTQEQSGRLYVDWSFSATDETRTFTLTYRVTGQVKMHNDVAELYWKWVGAEWDQGVDSVSVRLTLPDGATEEQIRAWGHGPLNGIVQITSGQEVTWQVAPLPARTFLEGRVTFPTGLISTGENARFTNTNALDTILREEGAWAEEANRTRWFSKLDLIFGALIPIVALFLAWNTRRRFGSRYETTFNGDYYRELPGTYSPAEMGVLWRFGLPSFDDLTATIVDLARRGYMRIDEYAITRRGLFAKDDVGYRLTRLDKNDGLAKHETDLLEFLFDVIDREDDGVTFAEIERFAKRSPRRFKSFWDGWTGIVRYRGDELDFFDNGPEIKKGSTILWSSGVAAMLLGIVIAVYTGRFGVIFSGLGFILAGIIFLVAAVGMRRRSRQGEEDYVRWQAFKRFLQHFSKLDEYGIPSLVIWEHYLVYAISLGVAKEVLKQLELVYPNLQQGDHRFAYGWFYFHRGHMGLLSMSRGLNSITNTMQSSLRAATTPKSSGAGRGGGFSGGGGFGGGGGGGGVR